MRTVDARQTRPPLALWDVQNVAAHVRAILHTGLGKKGARLNGQQTESALDYLDAKCWELSGLEANGKTLRYVYVIRGFYKPRSEHEKFEAIKAHEFGREPSARIALVRIEEVRPVAFARVERQRPAGAFDPTRGLSFSTYSHRILIRRIWDWYRSDPEFGDTRYSSGRSTESLEGLGERMQRDKEAGEEWIDRNGPGARLEFIDELNRHAYHDPIEEMLTREAVGC